MVFSLVADAEGRAGLSRDEAIYAIDEASFRSLIEKREELHFHVFFMSSLWPDHLHESVTILDLRFANTRPQVNLYDRLGAEVIKEIAEAFYQRVYADKHQLSTTGESIRGVFANTTKADAVDGHFRFLVERLGGPALYTSTKGPYQLIGRHAPYAGVNDESAERWLHHMVRRTDVFSSRRRGPLARQRHP